MKQSMVEISFTGNNFSAHVPELPGCVSTGNSPVEVKENIKDAISFHLAGMAEDGEVIPENFIGSYELIYKFDAPSLLNYYKGIFTNAAFERITGINQKQIQHYASGHRSPRADQKQKIKNALHKLGEELISVEL